MSQLPHLPPKVTALRQQGTFNPHPERVTDELFLQSEFFDRHDLVQVKYEMLRRVELDGWSVTRSARRFGFSRPSFYQAQSAFRQRGPWGLVPQRRGPRRAHKLSAEVMQVVEEGRKEDPSLSVGALAELVKERFGLVVHPRSIERRLHRQKKRH